MQNKQSTPAQTRPARPHPAISAWRSRRVSGGRSEPRDPISQLALDPGSTAEEAAGRLREELRNRPVPRTASVSTQPPTFLRCRQVVERTGISRSLIYAYMRTGTFPAPIRISARRVGWLESEVTAWIAERLSANKQRGGR
jgi:prophage regulatory protein